MFGEVLTGFLMGAGVAAWVYSKMMRQTGNNTQQAVITCLIAGGATFLVVASLMSLIPE